MADDQAHPFFQISPVNHSPWVVVTTITFMVYSILAVAAKIISRLHISRMKGYDWLIVTSATFALAQTSCIVGASKNGLGQHLTVLSPAVLDAFSKFTYAASILFIVAVYFAKISVVMFIKAITPSKPIHWFCNGLSAVITAGWLICGIFALAFQCGSPSRWTSVSNECIDQTGLQLFLGVINIVTDIALVLLPAFIMKNVQTNATRKLQVITLFGSRLLVPAFSIPQLVAYHDFYKSSDHTWDMVPIAIWGQLIMNLSILTACIPSLKGVLDMFGSGTSLFTVPAQYETTLGSSSNNRLGTVIAQTFGLRSKRSGNRSVMDTNLSATEWPTHQMKKFTGQHLVEVSSTVKEGPSSKHIPARSESQTSLTQNIIMRTVNFEVGYEENKPQNTPGTDHHSHSSIDPEEHDFVQAQLK